VHALAANGRANKYLSVGVLIQPETNLQLYLNSDLAAKVTGVTIPVDAGHLILTPFNLAPAR
jgi:enoyl-[acyl-carrier-protein] reductase (NADH)